MEEWRKIKIILYGLMIFAILASIFGVIFISYTNSQTQIITIQDKYVKEGIYYIADTNGNTYIVEDLIFLGKWNSSDLYNGMKIGYTYQVKTCGLRIRFLDNYPNINEFELLEGQL